MKQLSYPSSPSPISGAIRFKTSVLSRAKRNDSHAISIMFRQFIPEDESVHFVQYLGSKGILGIGAASFACLTDRRVADITVGFFGEVTYEDSYLETLQSSAIYQPSRLSLFLITALTALVALYLITIAVFLPWLNFFVKFLMVIAIVAIWFLVHVFILRMYYGLVKCGVRFFGTVSGLTSVYIYTNRRLIKRANILCREFAIRRDLRMKELERMQR